MKLRYIGPHEGVVVPIDDYASTEVKRGESANFPDAIANGLLEQGQNSDPNGPHDPQWEKVAAPAPAAVTKADKKDGDS